MYLKIGEKELRCTGAPSLGGETLRFYLPEGGEALAVLLEQAPAGVLELRQDDGFEMWTCDVSGYARWGMEGETLVITNLPVPEPAPEPEPPPLDALTMTQLAVAELAQTVEDNNTANQLAIAELAETVLGGNV